MKLSRIFWIVVLIGSLIALWSIFIEPNRLIVRKETIISDRWHNPPLKIAFMTDLHAGAPFINLKKIQTIVDKINAENPDLILLGGDYLCDVVGGKQIPVEDVVKSINGLKAPLGVYGILGNHDEWNARRIPMLNAFAQAHIRMLVNEAIHIQKNNYDFSVAGLDDVTAGNPNVTQTFGGIKNQNSVIALIHDPGLFKAMTDQRIALTLAGHTHGGQIYLPFYGALYVPPIAPRKLAYGIFDGNGHKLLVSGGIGTSVLPIRFNMPPEIVIVDLHGS